ncbi:sigma-70 family RNA polymerase sigma factor [Vibrio alginolyticus]|uniref:sigma-70 family RNA polymerase sigma factor n=1 Tax=Vibrio alginolyticus TaxID=663 RepID=UPI0006CA9C4C|nr:sigma-70 family RNA polymerase sigma factor [Vibrio alginolyticus]KPM98579.1 hypothetical protein AOG25_09075 [Vibrio alginolyticus]CAH7156159.1 RNA polymerase sigma factor for flagellar operon [Vibrio chagasii]CAH7325983.1 RNA polymerase sigma factor for flagellar operon [Vibrio chagasii]
MKRHLSQVKTDKELTENFEEHRAFVRKTLSSLLRAHGFVISKEDQEDLTQIGLIALLGKLREFDSSKGVPFYGFAKQRVSGAIMDELRKSSTIPRRQHKFFKEYSDLKNQAAAEGRQLTIEEAAQKLGVDIDIMSSMLLQWESRNEVSIDDEDSSLPEIFDGNSNPEALFGSEELKERIGKAIQNLEHREQVVLSLYYDGEMTLSEMSKRMELSETRLSQIKNNAIKKIRSQIL